MKRLAILIACAIFYTNIGLKRAGDSDSSSSFEVNSGNQSTTVKNEKGSPPVNSTEKSKTETPTHEGAGNTDSTLYKYDVKVSGETPRNSQQPNK